eukprot:1161780-Pelagomonas_calceolata.AAC.9
MEFGGYAQYNRSHRHPEGCPRVFTVINFYQEHMPLVRTQLMRLSGVGSCVGPAWGTMPAA